MADSLWFWTPLLLLSIASYTQESWDGKWNRHFRPHHNDHRHWGPFFEETPVNASGPPGFSSGGVYALAVPAGGPLHLDCRVAMLHDKTVMWVKKTTESVSLLTVGPLLYSADSRVSLKFLYPNNWRLEINPVQEGDAGLYMCQLSTHPPRVRATNVTVLCPEVMIIDEQSLAVSERHYQEGSRIVLLCRARLNSPNSLSTTDKLQWRKDGEKALLPLMSITFRAESSGTIALARLVIPSAVPADSGIYSCLVEDKGQAFINVHILQGETHAAVHHEASGSTRIQTAWLVGLFTLHKLC